MLVVISPAKSLDMTPVQIPATAPAFQDDALRLAKTARGLSLGDLKSLMAISDDLARLNRDRFAAFAAYPAPEAVKPAALAFNGDTYQGLEAKTL
ncbi:MAG: peroxide stress protein YaaA, partial [Proteobacteria bacterium]|nr:peroxide stress protein YaaA [Pseudomonadota bacterium]